VIGQHSQVTHCNLAAPRQKVVETGELAHTDCRLDVCDAKIIAYFRVALERGRSRVMPFESDSDMP
jgi:hypothetical protein